MIPVADRDLVALLQQDILWRSHGDDDRLHTQHLDHMPAEHRANVLAWLRSNAAMLHELQSGHLTRQWKGGYMTGDQWADEIRYLAALDPAVWVEEQPLVRRLVALVPREALPTRGVLARIRGWRG